MANVDPIRRAEIGREKRARTRAQLVAAAKLLFATRAVESVTVDDVVKGAGVAKGPFYVHFKDLRELTATVADELIESIDSMLQPGRLSIRDPALRIAFGCGCFIDKALSDPGWACVVARMAATAAIGGENTRRHLFEDLSRFSKGLRGGISPKLSQEIVVGIMLRLLGAFAEGRLSSRDRDAAIGAILRAIGLNARQVNAALASLPRPHEGVVPNLSPENSRSRARSAGRASRAPESPV
jgi:AcrR family transcriptional regulator